MALESTEGRKTKPLPGAARYRFISLLVLTTFLSVFLLSSAALPAPRPTQSHSSDEGTGARDPRFDAARAYIREVMKRYALPSISVAVAEDGKIVWEQGFGWADRERKEPATPDTMYSLASLTKSFTAVAVMRLVEQGMIGLDASANAYLGRAQIRGLAGDASGATIRRILEQTSGLPLHWDYFYNDEPRTPPPAETTIFHYGILVTPPGAVYQYSNLGYGILGHIIYQVSGMRYSDYMRREVFLPLGLTRTSVGIAPGLGPYATRYDLKGRPIPFYTFDHVAASAIYSSAHDLVRFGMFELKDRLPGQQPILKNATIDETHKPVVPIGFQGTDYAMSWFVHLDDHGYVNVFGPGYMPGVTTMLSLYPAANLAVVVLTNKNIGPLAIEPVSEHIAAALLPKYAAALRANPHEYPGPPDKPNRPATELAGRWRGDVKTWQGEIPLAMDVRADGEIHVRLGDEPEAVLQQAGWNGQELSGYFPGKIPTPDADRYHSVLFVELWLRDGALTGEINAEALEPPPHYSLASFAKLERVPPKK
jgi:CubicO group peptidase (beta-lactamase class C family)